jgi:putative transposase
MSDKISIIHRSLKIRLYPDKNQKILLNKTFGCCRLLYNERLAEHIEWYNANKGLPKDQRSKFKGKLPKQLREEKYEFLSDAIAEPLIQSQRNCEQAFSNFFKSITKQRKGKKVGFPKFKSKKQHRDSFSIYMLPKNCLDWEHRLVAIPKLKQVKFRHAEDKSKKWIGWFKEATIRSMTISRNACEEYWCSILFEREQDIYSTICPIKAIGLDFSPNSLYINDLNEVAPGFRKAKQENKKKLTRLQRNLMKKQKDSKNREKARIKLAQFENHIANIRRDYREKETLRLVRTYDIIGIEDLNLQGMMKFSHNAKNYVDCSWYSFVTRLEQKAKSNNCLIIKSDRFYPSSKTCNHCGYVNKNLKLSDRTWICPKYEAEIIRDQNAALNLKENALKILLEEIKSSLLLEQQEVMSMEDMEINLCNSEICGVSVEVENQSGDALKKKLFGL